MLAMRLDCLLFLKWLTAEGGLLSGHTTRWNADTRNTGVSAR
jgi:hypothetical protein